MVWHPRFAVNSENATKMAKHAKDLDFPTTTLIIIFKNKYKIISYQSIRENTMQPAAILIKEHFKPVPSPRGVFGGIAPSNWIMNHYVSVAFYQISECTALLNVKPPYWKLSADGSAANPCYFPGFGIEVKKHFRNDLLQFAYNDAFSPLHKWRSRAILLYYEHPLKKFFCVKQQCATI